MAAELTCDFTVRFPDGPEIRAALELPLEGFSVLALLGPSGSGKTTVLRALAGLAKPREGFIRFGDRPWFDQGAGVFVPAHRRGMGYLSQEGALFPHLTVGENLAYGLGDLEPAARRARVGETLDLLGLSGMERRHPGQLSGGQQRRIALGRTIARRPPLLLLDEPFSGLDPDAQEQLRSELRRLLKELARPAVLVTHDRADALGLGDRLAVMEEGRVLQRGPIQEVFEHPGGAGVARILGVDTVHLGRVVERRQGLAVLGLGSAVVLAPDPGGLEEQAFVCIRGEDVILESEASHSTVRNRLPGTITGIRPEGPLVRVSLDCGFPLSALITRPACEDLGLEVGGTVAALVKAAAIHLIPH
jgi:molybdate transport system ATP-binding protein